MGKYNVRVKIKDTRKVPFIGKGKILNPIYITREQFNILKTLGYDIEEINDQPLKNLNLNLDINEKKEITEEIVKDESEEIELTDNNELVEEETIEEDNEFIDDEEIVNEEDMEVSINSLTKREIKTKLDEMKIEYPNNANLATLRDILTENL